MYRRILRLLMAQNILIPEEPWNKLIIINSSLFKFQICDLLAQEKDTIRKEYWLFLGRSLKCKFAGNSSEEPPESSTPQEMSWSVLRSPPMSASVLMWQPDVCWNVLSFYTITVLKIKLIRKFTEQKHSKFNLSEIKASFQIQMTLF